MLFQALSCEAKGRASRGASVRVQGYREPNRRRHNEIQIERPPKMQTARRLRAFLSNGIKSSVLKCEREYR